MPEIEKMSDAMSSTELLRRALRWEKALIIFSFWSCVVLFLGPGVLLGMFVAPAVVGIKPFELPALVHLVGGGFVGLVGVGTLIIAANFLCRIALNAVRGKAGSD